MKKLFIAMSSMLFAACAPKYPTVTPEQVIKVAKIILPKVLFPYHYSDRLEKSRHHAGCIAFDVFQSATRSDVFMFCETWKDDASLKAHAETPEFKKYVAEIEACGQMKLERFEF